MEIYKLLKLSYIGKFKRIYLNLDRNLELYAEVITLDNSEEKYLIKSFKFEDIALNKSKDLEDKLKALSKYKSIESNF